MKNVTLIALALSFALAACSDSNTGTESFNAFEDDNHDGLEG